MQIFSIIAQPFGYLLFFLYKLFSNYGWALVAFTIIVKVLMLPLSIKQQKSMTEMQKIQPLLAKIQEKYKNDKEKLSTEMMKLYKEHDVNPAGGCLPMLIQLPIIFVLFNVIREPLKYMFNLTPQLIEQLQNIMQIPASQYLQIQISQNITPEILKIPEFAHLIRVNFNFLGLDLGAIPDLKVFSLLWIIPLLSGLSSYFVSKLSQAQAGQPSKAGEQNPTASSMKMMTTIMPFMSAWFCFSFPAGVGFYWILSNIFQLGQQYFLDNYFKKNMKNPLVIEKQTTEVKSPKKKGGQNNGKN